MSDPALNEVTKRLNAKFMEYFAANDMKSLSELYTEDCKMLTPGMDVQVGRKAAEECCKSIYEAGGVKLVFQSTEMAGCGDFAYDCGTYTLFREDGTVFDQGNTLVVFKKVNGEYYYHVDCFNSSKK